MRTRVVAPLMAAVLGIAGGVVTALVVPTDSEGGRQPESNGGGESLPSDPLNLGIHLENQGCSGASLLVVGYGDTFAPLSSAVANSGKEGLRYLRTADSCDTLLGPEAQPAPAYVVYLGPYDSRREPCEIRMSGEDSESFVARLREGNQSLVKCPCELPSSAAPHLFLDMDPNASERLWIRGLQNMLHDDDPEGFPRTAITGDYDQPTADRVAAFQDRAPATVTVRGEVDETTWRILTGRLCRQYDY
jgi:hypothetical protein